MYFSHWLCSKSTKNVLNFQCLMCWILNKHLWKLIFFIQFVNVWLCWPIAAEPSTELCSKGYNFVQFVHVWLCWSIAAERSTELCSRGWIFIQFVHAWLCWPIAAGCSTALCSKGLKRSKMSTELCWVVLLGSIL